jgi:hypothetical protein
MFLIAALALCGLGSHLHAVSPFWEVDPKSLDDNPVAFDIHSQRLPTGDIEFTIKISDRPDQPHKIPDRIDAGLNVMDFNGDSPTGGRSLRRLKPERRGKTLVFVFTVTPKELAEPGLCFGIGWDGGFQSVESYFVRLKKFLPP